MSDKRTNHSAQHTINYIKVDRLGFSTVAIVLECTAADAADDLCQQLREAKRAGKLGPAIEAMAPAEVKP